MSVELPLLWKASLVQVVKQGNTIFDEDGEKHLSPGIFQLVIPAELVEDTLNELLPLLGRQEILLLIMAIPILKTRAAEQSPWRNWASNILIVVLVAVFMVWTVDTVLWLAVQILQYPFALQSLGHSHQVSEVPPGQILSVMRPLLSMVGCTVVDLEQVTL